MTNPITPPPDLVQQWARSSSIPGTKTTEGQWQQRFARQAAQWGADQSGAAEIQKARDEELEACVEWLEQNCGRWELPAGLRAARRPKPPSLKEQALGIIDDNIEDDPAHISFALEEIKTIRRALEALPND